MRRYLLPLMLVLCAILALSAGCSRNKGQTPTDQAGLGLGSGAAVGDGIGQSDDERRKPLDGMDGNGVFQTIYFDYDRSDIRADQTERIEQNAKFLTEHPDVTVLIEGHCDERGTVEYNFALGEHRAEAIRDFLVSRGVKAGNISVLSKGEEEPAVQGSDEQAWSQNRRAEFKVTR